MEEAQLLVNEIEEGPIEDVGNAKLLMVCVIEPSLFIILW